MSCVKELFLRLIQQEEQEFKNLLNHYGIKKVIGLVPGGKESQDSVYNGLKSVADDGIILVHDAARPFIRSQTYSSN